MFTDAACPVPVGHTLLPIARAAIATALGRRLEAVEDAAWLQETGACFVTLTQQGQLRGCIGTLQAHRTLLADVKANAVAAALHDPRFAPLATIELERTEIEVSLLSPLQALQFDSEAHVLAQLRPGVDGMVLEFGHYRSTFCRRCGSSCRRRPDFWPSSSARPACRLISGLPVCVCSATA
jgi:Uncharacterized conserved protein